MTLNVKKKYPECDEHIPRKIEKYKGIHFTVRAEIMYIYKVQLGILEAYSGVIDIFVN